MKPGPRNNVPSMVRVAAATRKKVKNLIQIFLSTPVGIRASDRLRFLREYGRRPGIDRATRREMAREVLAFAGITK